MPVLGISPPPGCEYGRAGKVVGRDCRAGSDDAYRKGVAFLPRTQAGDGTWPVKALPAIL